MKANISSSPHWVLTVFSTTQSPSPILSHLNLSWYYYHSHFTEEELRFWKFKWQLVCILEHTFQSRSLWLWIHSSKLPHVSPLKCLVNSYWVISRTDEWRLVCGLNSLAYFLCDLGHVIYSSALVSLSVKCEELNWMFFRIPLIILLYEPMINVNCLGSMDNLSKQWLLWSASKLFICITVASPWYRAW